MELLEPVTPASMALHEPPLVKYLHLSDRSIAYRHLEGRSPTLIYVGGFLSTMEIHKATIIEQYAKVHGRASIRYDQASVGLSTGIHRRDATASNEPWIQDLMAIMDILADKGPAILIASSNGAQICCHVAKVRPQQVKGLVLIGPSLISGHLNWILAMEQDMVPKDVLERYEKGEDINYNTAYGKGYITKEGHEKMKKYAINIDEPIEIHCPIRIIHALKDEEVDLEKSQIFLENVASKNVDLVVRKQGNHRLMKPRDLTLLTYVIHKLIEDVEKLNSKV